MRKNVLKQLTMALLIVLAMPCAKAQMAHIGDILCEGDLIVSPANYNANTHTAIGVIFYVDNTGQHGWAVALEDAGSYSWGDGDTPLINYSGGLRQIIYDLDGYENTRIVREHSTNHTAFYAVDFENGWYVPALGQMNYLYGNLMDVNKTLSAIGGVPFSTNEGWEYWSSTEYDGSNAWNFKSSGDMGCTIYHLVIGGGWSEFYVHKSDARRVRAVRSF